MQAPFATGAPDTGSTVTVESVPYSAVAEPPCSIQCDAPPNPQPPNFGTVSESIVLRNVWNESRGFHCVLLDWMMKPLSESSMPLVDRMPPLRNSEVNPNEGASERCSSRSVIRFL